MVPIGAQAVTNEAGYYIYGSRYDGTTNPSSSTKLHYKLSPLNGSTTEYFIDLFADDKTMAGVNRYSTGNDMSDSEGVYADMDRSTFKLCYISSNDGNPVTYSPNANGDSYWLTNTTPPSSFQTLNQSTSKSWYVQNNGGMYRLIIKVNASGTPISWNFENHPNQLVIYKLSAASNWTIDGFFYCTRSASGNHSGNYHGYNQQFFGTSTFTKDGEFLFLLGDRWLKRNKNNTNNKYTKNTSWDDTGGAPNLTFEYATGVYGVMYNPTQDEYQLRGPGNSSDKIEIWIAGNAVSSAESTSNFSDWSTNNSIQLTYSDAEACWKGTLVFTKNKDMRFLHNNDKTKYFGEDANAPTSATVAVGGDTQLNNKVAYKNLNNNIHFLIPSGRYIVRFYMKAAEGKNFTDEAVYWYTLELVEKFTGPTVDLSPASQSVPDNQTITTSLTADNTTYFAYTVGTAEGTPTIDSKATVAANFFGTLSYDKKNDRISWGDNNDNNYVSGRTITITVQAVTADGTALVDGTKVTRTYTFTDTSVTITPDGGFFINKKELTLGGTAPYNWNVKDASNNVIASGTIESGNTLMLSTAGTLTVTDANKQSGTADFDFTYSTSENYSNYYSNSKTLDVVGPTVFVNNPRNSSTMPYIKAVDANNSDATIINWTQIPTTNSKTDGAGNTWYYYSFDTQYSNIKLYFSADGTSGKSTKAITMTGDKYFVYDYNSSKNNETKNGVYLDMTGKTVAAGEVLYIDNQSWGTVNICSWVTQGNNHNSSASLFSTVYQAGGTTKNVYKGTPIDQSNLLFNKTGGDYTNKTADYTYTSNMLYQHWSGSGNAIGQGKVFAVPTGAHSFTLATGTYTYAKPNGDDYYRVMSKDKTYLLDPTWNSSANITTQTSVKSWDMVSDAHSVNGSISQKVTGLTADKEYAVQALVSSTNMNDITLTLTGANSGTATLGSHYSGMKNFVNKYGRVEFLDNQVDKNTTTMWQVLYAKAQANASGELTIALSCANSGTFYLTDVVLLEGKATERQYIMSVATGEDKTEADLSDRTQYNAFSFFNRGINLNSVIYVSDHTVLGVAPGVLTDDAASIDRRHPYNVAAYNATTGAYTMKKMYLTDQQSAGKTGNDNAFGVSKTFTTSSFYYDRNITSTTNKMSSYLPIALTSSEIPGGNAYVFDHIDNVNNTVYFTNVSSVAANTPFFFVSPKTGVVFDIKTEKTVVASPAAKTISEATTGSGCYMLGFYHQASNVGSTTSGYRQGDYVPYFYQNGKFSWAKETAHVNPFRAIFMHNTGTTAPASMVALWDEPEVTGIDEVETITPQSTAIYSIDGKLVNRSGNTDGLRKGVYIMNGKKFIVK